LLNFPEAEARDWVAAGFTFIAVAGDASLLARQTERVAAAFKS
jgi:4-hydroxy-2-oxoheptanedioate aldolase